jgi:hypothetical protein
MEAMMRKWIGMTVAAAAATFTLTASASAQDVYAWPDKATPVVVHNESGLFFVGKDKTVWRAYTWKQATGKKSDPLQILDLDKDGNLEIVGAGKPTFVLKSNSDPIWFDKNGCDQVLTGDFTADDKGDVVCIRGNKIRMLTHDNQMVWEVSIGKRFDWCRGGDVNGDLKNDVECKLRGKNSYARFDGSSGEVLTPGSDDEQVTDNDEAAIQPMDGDSIAGKTMHDLNGDGTAEESFLADGKAFAIQSRSAKKALGRVEMKAEPVAIHAVDLDGDKKLEVVAVSDKEIVITDATGKDPKSFSASGRSYKRKPVAQLDSVYANGFADDAAAKKAVEDNNDKLDKCYASAVRKNQFAGTGRTLVKIDVDDKGKVKSAQKLHSDLADSGVVKCAVKVLEKAKYGNAAEGGTGMVNVTITYTFRSE